MNPIPKEIKEVLREILEDLPIKDLFVVPRNKVIYLYGTNRNLENLFNGKGYFVRRILSRISPEEARRIEISTWYEIEYVLKSMLINKYGGYDFWEDWDVIPIPYPGRPDENYYSVKKDKFLSPHPLPAYSFCDEKLIEIGDAEYGSGILRNRNSKIPPLFISHAVAFESFKNILNCGGFLWPSLAITWKVPPSYGDILFLADVNLLKNATSRRVSKFVITESDSYSPTSEKIRRLEKAIDFELRGDIKWWHNGYERSDGGMGIRRVQDNIFYKSLDPYDVVGGLAPDQKFLTSMREIWWRFKHLLKHHTKVVGPFEYEDKDELIERSFVLKPFHSSRGEILVKEESIDIYPYMEMKARGVLGINNMVACFYPKRNKKRVKTFLDKMNFKGCRIPVDVKTPKKTQSNDKERVVWANAMNQSIAKWIDSTHG